MKGKVAIVTGCSRDIGRKVSLSPSLRRERKGEVGDLVSYHASDASSFINGESVEINRRSYFN